MGLGRLSVLVFLTAHTAKCSLNEFVYNPTEKTMSLLSITCFFFVVLLSVKEISTVDLCKESEISSYLARNENPKQCGCERTSCIRKCCSPGFFLQEKSCVRSNDTLVQVPVYTEKTVEVGVTDLSDNVLVGVLQCYFFQLNNSDVEDKFYLQETGELWVPLYRLFFGNEKYCLDELEGGTAFLCFPDDPDDSPIRLGRKFNAVGMIISMPFLLATFIVYAILPDSNIHRKALMFYVLTLLLAYIFLVTIQLHQGKFENALCQILGYAVIFFFIGSFFWMNVMCIDMWLAFSGLRGFTGQRHAERKRFLLYCLYALGVPILLVILVVLINTYGDKDRDYYPGVGEVKCFLNDGWPNLYYFYGPMATITIFNITLFVLTSIKIQRVKKETSMLKHSDSKRHSYEDDKQKFNLYLKLLFAMGINWSMEVISWAFLWKMGSDVPAYVWYLTDFCNAMYGVFIFFIFVFKKKIWKSLQKRYYVFIGKPHLARSLTTTQTTRSISTTDTALDHRLSEFKNGREERPLARN